MERKRKNELAAPSRSVGRSKRAHQDHRHCTRPRVVFACPRENEHLSISISMLFLPLKMATIPPAGLDSVSHSLQVTCKISIDKSVRMGDNGLCIQGSKSRSRGAIYGFGLRTDLDTGRARLECSHLPPPTTVLLDRRFLDLYSRCVYFSPRVVRPLESSWHDPGQTSAIFDFRQ